MTNADWWARVVKTFKMVALTVGLLSMEFTSICTASPAQTIPERVRANPTVPMTTGVLVDIRPLSIEQLTAGAELVVKGTLTRPKSYLTADENYILTDYLVIPERIIAGRVPASQTTAVPATPMILSVQGGELSVEGVPVRGVNYALVEELQTGREYLLFLRPFGSREGQYQLYMGGAFAIGRTGIRPLLKGYGQVFQGIADTQLPELVRRVENAAAK
jgi:hypothetical protein